MTERERHFAGYLRTLPSFIDWVHYMSFMVSISIGPMCEYSTFHDFINMKETSDATKMRPFSNWFTAWKRFIEVWLCAALFMILAEKFDWWYLASSEFVNDPLWYKLYYLLMSMQVMMWQLFTGFATQEANMIACGMSYKAATKTEPEEFNHVRMVKIVDFELMTNPVKAISNWNISVHHWLKYYWMLRWMDRSQPRGKIQLGPFMLTFIVSPLWHGFYFGYFAFFTGLGLMDFTWKEFGKTKLAHMLDAKLGPLSFVFNLMLSHLAIAYFGMCHCLQLASTTFAIWSAFYYVGHIACISVIIFAKLLPKQGREKVAAQTDGNVRAQFTGNEQSGPTTADPTADTAAKDSKKTQ